MKTSHSFLRSIDMPDPRTMERIRQRPLGTFSDFAVRLLHQNPYDMSPRQLSADVDRFAKEALSCLPINQDGARLALLDASMIESTLAVRQRVQPDSLLELTEKCATQAGSSPCLSYEGLVHTNPLSTDPRTFTVGNTARSELLFYKVHRNVEDVLAHSTINARKILATPASADISLLVETIEHGIEGLRTGFRTMIQELSKEDFAKIRIFFHNQHRKMPGPSALFSAGTYCIDSLICGSNEEMRSFLNGKNTHRIYYPSTEAAKDSCAGQQDMKEADAMSQSKLDGISIVRRQGSANDREKIASALLRMIQTRHIHLGVVKRFIPELFRMTSHPAAKGTGDTQHVPTFLHAPLNIYKRLHAEFSTSSPS